MEEKKTVTVIENLLNVMANVSVQSERNNGWIPSSATNVILNWPERMKTQPHDDRDNCFLPFDSKGPCGMAVFNDIDDDGATTHSDFHTPCRLVTQEKTDFRYGVSSCNQHRDSPVAVSRGVGRERTVELNDRSVFLVRRLLCVPSVWALDLNTELAPRTERTLRSKGLDALLS